MLRDKKSCYSFFYTLMPIRRVSLKIKIISEVFILKNPVQCNLFVEPEWQRGRPQCNDGTNVNVAIKDIAKKLHKHINREELKVSQVAEDLNVARQKASDPYNGYLIAKILEKFGYNPDVKFIKICDSYKENLEKAQTQGVKDWVIEYNITPDLNVGDTAKVNIKNNEIDCKIIGIDRSMAQYEILCEKSNPATFYVDFEDVTFNADSDLSSLAASETRCTIES